MVTDNGSVTFNFNDGHNEENIWGSGRLFMIITVTNFCEMAIIINAITMHNNKFTI